MTFVRVCAKFDYLTLVTSATYGGNPEQIYLVGHSAGGHLVLCTMLQQIMKHMVRDAYASFLTSSIEFSIYLSLVSKELWYSFTITSCTSNMFRILKRRMLLSGILGFIQATYLES
jgi:hypothetical protein